MSPATHGALERNFLVPGSEDWAVFGDELSTRGDPRGELIAIEQQIELAPFGIEGEQLDGLQKRRDRLYAQYAGQWGGALNTLSVRRAVTLSWRYGYCSAVTLDIDEDIRPHALLRKVLESEATTYLPQMHLRSHTVQAASIVEVLSESLWPLQALTVELRPSQVDFPTIIDVDTCAALMDSLPLLRQLSIRGRRLFADISHPSLESVQISGYDAITGLGLTTLLPNLEQLDVALLTGTLDDCSSEAAASHATLESLLSGDGLPALRILDLSRNGTGFGDGPRRLGGAPSRLWSALAKSRLLFQLDELVLPPLDANGGNALLEVAPALRRVAKLRMPLVLEREQGMSAERMQDEFAQRLEFGAVFTHRLAMDVFGDELLMITTCDPTPRHVSMRELVGVYETALERIVPSARAVIDAALMEVEGLDESSDADHPTFTDLATSVLSGAIRELCRVAKVERGGLLELSRLLAEHESCCATVRATLDRGW